MARQVGRVLRYLAPLSKAQYSSQLVRSNLINLGGSTHQGRDLSFKLLGFSASLVAFGFGVHVINNRKEEEESTGSLGPSRVINFWGKPSNSKEVRSSISGVVSQALYFQSSGSRNLERQLFRNQTTDKERRLSLVGSLFLTYCPFVTPASCADKGDVFGEFGDGNAVCQDVICTCMVCSQSRKEAYSSEANVPKGGGGVPKGNNNQQCTNQPKVQNQTTNTDPLPSEPKSSQPPPLQANKFNTKTTSGPTPVSNKTCGSYSACSKASDPDVDIETLSKTLGGVKQMDWSMETDLSHCILMRQASQVTVDSVTRIVTEAISAYDDYHSEYRRVLDLLMDALELSRRVCGADEEVLECKIILIRAKSEEIKRKITDIDMFFGSLEKLCNAAAETAFMSHAEYASIAMSERLQSMICEVKRLRDETREKERDMLELQSLIIVETGKSLK